MWEVFLVFLFVAILVLNWNRLNRDDVWKSLLIAIPTELVLYETLVGNAIFRINGEGSRSFRPLAIFTILFSPLNIFGQTGFTRYFLWTLPFAYQNVFYIWAVVFAGLTFLRRL